MRKTLFSATGFFLAASLVGTIAHASEAVSVGTIRQLTFRSGYLDFKIVGDDNTNYCQACPTDPGAQGTQKCWVPETQKTQVAIILAAYTQGKKISGRVPSFASDCTFYEMTVQD